MPAYTFAADEERSNSLILIIDREGIFGEVLVEKLLQFGQIVFVSKKELVNASVIHVPFGSSRIQIPDGTYSHVFFIFDGQEDVKELLEPVLSKTHKDSAHIVLVAPRELYSESLQELVEKGSSRANIILLGDIFGNPYISSPVMQISQKARTGRVLLSDMGLSIVYPAPFSMTIDAILQIGFGAEKKKLLLAFAKHPNTELSVAHWLQKIEPDIKIDFSLSKESQGLVEEKDLPDGEYLLNDTKGIVEELQKAFVGGQISFSKKGSKQKGKGFWRKIGELRRRKRKISFRAGLLLSILLVLAAPYLAVFGASLLGMFFLNTAKNQAASLQPDNAMKSAQAAGVMFAFAKFSFVPVEKELGLVGQAQRAGELAENIDNGALLSNVGASLLDAYAKMQSVQKSQSFTSSSDSSLMINDVKQAALSIAEMHAGDGVLYADQIAMLKKGFPIVANIADALPRVLGIGKKQQYLILFQNNMELRPGGGFIGSFATVTMDNGQMKDFAIKDVYDADGQLHGHIEPPFVLRRFIPVQHWYLRDSNFDVDFQKDAQSAAYFLKAELGQNVDGVIAIDLSFVKKLIGFFGPIHVAQYNEDVTESNFFSLAESHAEKNFFPGSTQKKDFLSSVFQGLQAKIFSQKEDAIKLLPVVASSLEDKHLLLSFADASTEEIFTINNLSSSLWDPRGGDPLSVNAFTGINEANIGVNKANAFITRSVKQKVTIDDKGTVSGVLQTTYENKSTGEWPGGSYRNYMRIILPEGAQITGVTIQGKNQEIASAVTDPKVFESASFNPPAGLEVDKVNESNKSIYGFVVTVAPKSTQQIVVSYTLSEKVSVSSPTFTYEEILFKQPGTDVYPYSWTLSYPSSFSLLSKTDAKVANNTISTSWDFEKDASLHFEFAKK